MTPGRPDGPRKSQFGNQSWQGLVVIASGMSWDETRMSEKQLALHLARIVPVLFVDPAISHLTRLRKPALLASTRGPRLRVVQQNIARLTPLTLPGVSRPVLRDVAAWATRRAIARATRSLSVRPRALVVASLVDLFDSCDASVKVLYGTDDWITGGSLMGLSTTWLRKRERAQLRKADVVVAVSEQLAARWSAEGCSARVIPNGCDTDHFSRADAAPPAEEVTLPDPIAGFIGHLSDRIDLGALERIADRGVSLLLVCPRQPTFSLEKVDALLERENVQWVGPQPFDRLPSFMKRIAVGLTPYTDSDFNRSSDPLKTLEYLAAGKPATVSDLPSARRIPGELIDICANPESFAEVTCAVLARGPDAELSRKRMEYAKSQSWDARARDFLLLFERG